MSIYPKKKSLVIFYLLMIFILFQSSCADFGNVKVRTWIDYPQQGDQFYLGDSVLITAHYYSEEGAGKVVLSVNGQAQEVIESPGKVKPVAIVKYNWIPSQIGTFSINVSVLTPEEVLLSSAQIEVEVLEVKEPVVEEVEEPTMGIFSQNGFCRLGPGTVYPAIAVYEVGQEITLEARSESLSPLWWYISDLTGEFYCWVSDIVIETDINPESLMAMEAPPVPDSGPGEGTGEESCHQDMDAVQCIASGGTWYSPVGFLADPYCICPE